MSEKSLSTSMKFRIRTANQDYEFHVFTEEKSELESMLYSAIINVELVSHRIGIPLKQRGAIKIKFQVFNYYGLFDPDEDGIIINPEAPIESTIFHELLHYFYPDLFNFPTLGGYLREGFPVFFEKQFYPDSWSEIRFLEDRINEKYPLYSVGYFLFKSFFDDVLIALKSDNPDDYFKESIPDIKNLELQSFKDHLSENILCFDWEADDPYGIIFSWDLKSPYIIHLKKDSNSQLAFSETHDPKFHISREEEWSNLLKRIVPHGNRIKQEYTYFSA